MTRSRKLQLFVIAVALVAGLAGHAATEPAVARRVSSLVAAVLHGRDVPAASIHGPSTPRTER